MLDLAKRAVAKVIDLSPYKSPHGIQIAPDGTVYVTAELDRKIVQVDPVRGRVIGAIDVEGSAHWMAILPDGSKMYVANKDDRLFVSVVDLKTKKIVAPRADGEGHAGHHRVARRQGRDRDGLSPRQCSP